MIHDYYNRITPATRNVIDGIFESIFTSAKLRGIHLNGSDKAKHAVEAMAKWFYESRQDEQAAQIAAKTAADATVRKGPTDKVQRVHVGWSGSTNPMYELREPCGCAWTVDGKNLVNVCSECLSAALAKAAA